VMEMLASWSRQVGGIDTGPKELLRASGSARFTPEAPLQRGQVQGRSVRQRSIRLVPDRLGRAEFGCVRPRTPFLRYVWYRRNTELTDPLRARAIPGRLWPALSSRMACLGRRSRRWAVPRCPMLSSMKESLGSSQLLRSPQHHNYGMVVDVAVVETNNEGN